jgi:hypothetical protein
MVGRIQLGPGPFEQSNVLSKTRVLDLALTDDAPRSGIARPGGSHHTLEAAMRARKADDVDSSR